MNEIRPPPAPPPPMDGMDRTAPAASIATTLKVGAIATAAALLVWLLAGWCC